MSLLDGRRWIVGVLVLVALSFGFAHVAVANANARYQQQIQQFKQMLEEQAEADERNLTERDRAQTSAWLQEAEVLLANGRTEQAARRLRRVEYSLDLIRAMVGAATIDTLADRQEAYYHTSKEQILQFEREIQELSAKARSLETELTRLRQ